MVRTQVMLSEHQHQQLKLMSKENGVSLSELVRQAIDGMFANQKKDKRKSMLDLIGAFEGGPDDVAENHDHYLWGEIPE